MEKVQEEETFSAEVLAASKHIGVEDEDEVISPASLSKEMQLQLKVLSDI